MSETVMFEGEFGTAVALGDPTEYIYGWDETVDEESARAQIEAFESEYEVLGSEYLGDPDESYYQGMTFTVVIRRRSDDKLFGFSYWKPVAKHSDYDIGPNCDELPGHEDCWEHYVFQEVEPFFTIGFKIKK